MNPLDSLGRSIKNIFVGSHRGEDFILENLEKTDKKKNSMPKDTNNLGVNPVEWFENPLDSMPIAKDYEPPRPEEDVADWFGEEKPKESSMKEEKSIHQKMYEIATAKYNPFAIGGSENIHDFDSLGGSENAQKRND
tara:strand:- start:567 stop:977 length:411 start_codon:yes stop_codon:yes gene_type:complete